MTKEESSTNQRRVSWFSAGAASAVATKLSISKHGHDDLVVAYCDTGSEHSDNARFIADCECWFDHEVVILKSPDFASVDDVIEKQSRPAVAGSEV